MIFSTLRLFALLLFAAPLAAQTIPAPTGAPGMEALGIALEGYPHFEAPERFHEALLGFLE